LSLIEARRGQLAVSLDTSLRQLGSAHTALREKDEALSRARRQPHVEEHPGLLQDLALLQLKLYGSPGPHLAYSGNQPSFLQ
ncbi:MAG: hypothetical protein SGPRY_013444, partial [Prymnesium sp.]